MMENQMLLPSPDGRFNRNSPERGTGPPYSLKCAQVDHTMALHYQEKDLTKGKMESKEEVMHTRGQRQSVEEDAMIRTVKVDTEAFVKCNHRSSVEGEIKMTIKEEEDGTYVMGYQQSMEEIQKKRTSKEEEVEMYERKYEPFTGETFVRDEQLSAEEGGMRRIIKDEEEETYVRDDQQSTEEEDTVVTIKQEDARTEIRTVHKVVIGNPSEISLILSPDFTRGDDVTDDSSEETTDSPNIHTGIHQGRPQQKKKFPCPDCEKSFGHRSDLKKTSENSHRREAVFMFRVWEMFWP
ncbi:uncharacterized protein [Hyperolius riggenbachi]|uniref:uncharacterized protein n=1 Tax=Hyperolius riggenbachi TaxID=752182 RepID=UPI0035A28539